MASLGARPLRRCARCGREGRNAFRTIAADRWDVWICTHEETCVARMHQVHRSHATRHNAPRTSGSAFDAGERPVCVIGVDADAVDDVASLVAGLTAADVDALVLSRASLNRLSRRDYALVVAIVRETDPVALVNDLTRRLLPFRRRAVPVIVACPTATMSPAVRTLAGATASVRITRPVDAPALLDALAATTETRLARSAS